MKIYDDLPKIDPTINQPPEVYIEYTDCLPSNKPDIKPSILNYKGDINN